MKRRILQNDFLYAVVFMAIILFLSIYDTFGQSRTARIYAPCPGTATNQEIKNDANGNWNIVPCPGRNLQINGSPIPGNGGVSSFNNRTGAISFGLADIPGLPAAQITSGYINPARLGQGQADTQSFLRGDGVWAVIPTSAGSSGGGGANAANIKIANDFPGADIGAKINAADAALGTAPGEIWVFGDQTMTTVVTLSSRHKLLIHEGTITTKTGDQSPFFLKDNSSIEGTGWNSVIVEHDANDDNVRQYFVVYAFNNSIVGTGGLTSVKRSNNITVKNLHFKGVRANPHDSGIRSTVYLGNCHQCRVEGNWFDETSGYATQFGGSPYEFQYSQDGWFINNLVTNVMSQNLAVISGSNIHIEGNTFRDPGKKPFRVTAVSLTSPVVITTAEPTNYDPNQPQMQAMLRNANPAVNGERMVERISATQYRILGTTAGTNETYGNGEIAFRTAQGAIVDIEPNGFTGREPTQHIIVKNNTFDLRGTTVQFSALSISIAHETPSEGIIVEGNTMLGNETGTVAAISGILMDYTHAHGVVIANNYIRNFSQYGMKVGGDRFKVDGNYIANCGWGGVPAFLAQDLRNSDITNNRVQNSFLNNEATEGRGTPTVSSLGDPYMWEKGFNYNNRWTNNSAQLLIMDGNGTVNWTTPYLNDVPQSGGGVWRTERSTYTGNQFTGGSVSGLDESASSNYNTFINNVTDLPDGSVHGLRGMRTRGANSKVITHLFTDGSIYIPNVRTVLPS